MVLCLFPTGAAQQKAIAPLTSDSTKGLWIALSWDLSCLILITWFFTRDHGKTFSKNDGKIKCNHVIIIIVLLKMGYICAYIYIRVYIYISWLSLYIYINTHRYKYIYIHSMTNIEHHCYNQSINHTWSDTLKDHGFHHGDLMVNYIGSVVAQIEPQPCRPKAA